MSSNTRFSEYPPQEMGITPEDIAQRKKFLEFTDDDVALLIEIHQHLESKHNDDSFADEFYRHLLSFPALRKLIPNEEAVNRLKALQSRYFLRLTAGEYNDDYVLDRLVVGYTHQRVGLEPKWYTGAYRKYLSSLLPILHEIFADDPAKFIAAYDAILKVVFFDMELALDTYFHSSMQKSLKLAKL